MVRCDPRPSSEFISTSACDLAEQRVATCTEQLAVFHFYIFPAHSNTRQCETLSDIPFIFSITASLLSMPRPLSMVSMDFMWKSCVLCAEAPCIKSGFLMFCLNQRSFHNPKLFTNTNMRKRK